MTQASTHFKREGAYGNDCPFCHTHNSILQSVQRMPLYYCRDCKRAFDLLEPYDHWVWIMDEEPTAHPCWPLEEEKVQFSVRIPYSETPTKWHPTEKEGRLSVLIRGSWDTEMEAYTWAEEHISGHDYQVVKF
jgi:hypothetical protein